MHQDTLVYSLVYIQLPKSNHFNDMGVILVSIFKGYSFSSLFALAVMRIQWK